MQPQLNPTLTKIIATVGPACAEVRTLQRLIEEGVRVFRINFSHGSFDDFASALANIRQASANTRIPVGVLGDLSGPKIRLCQVENEPIELAPGDRAVFVDRGDTVRREDHTVRIPTTYPALVEEVEPGQRVLIDDGAVRLLAVEREPGRLTCRVTHGGPIRTKKGVNLPDTTIRAPSLTEYDERCARWAVEQGLDFVALSFVRRAQDVERLRELLDAEGRRHGCAAPTPIIAKIERPEALRELEAIIDTADAVMVARGDLGVEMDVAQVPLIQKRIVRVAHDHGKPVIVATQMLQSMIDEPMPTRAEVSDVANAILDGADALMLSGETAVGRFPAQAVHVMAHTARTTEAEGVADRGPLSQPPRHPRASRYRTAALVHGVSVVAHDLGAKYVVMWSERGGGARYLSQNRMPLPIVAISSCDAALRAMSVLFGVTPVGMDRPAGTDAFIAAVDRLVLDAGWADRGTPIVIVHGEPLGTPGVTNKLRIHYVGDALPER